MQYFAIFGGIKCPLCVTHLM